MRRETAFKLLDAERLVADITTPDDPSVPGADRPASSDNVVQIEVGVDIQRPVNPANRSDPEMRTGAWLVIASRGVEELGRRLLLL